MARAARMAREDWRWLLDEVVRTLSMWSIARNDHCEVWSSSRKKEHGIFKYLLKIRRQMQNLRERKEIPAKHHKVLWQSSILLAPTHIYKGWNLELWSSCQWPVDSGEWRWACRRWSSTKLRHPTASYNGKGHEQPRCCTIAGGGWL